MSMTFALAVAALSGFIALSYEIVWYRLFAYASGGTAPAFALLLGFYLYGLAAGGLVARWICRGKPPGASQHLAQPFGWPAVAATVAVAFWVAPRRPYAAPVALAGAN